MTTLTLPNAASSADEVKQCCAALYESDWARLLLGESFHPGGLALTERIGRALALTPSDHVLDVAAGHGTAAIHLARTFGCRVTGVDLGPASVDRANDAAISAGVADRVRFRAGDAEHLPFADDAFDVLLCECAFCTFPDKAAAAAEFARVLRPGGRLALSDLTRHGPLPPELTGLLAWITCIADARPVAEYEAYLTRAGLAVQQVTVVDEALAEMVQAIRGRLLGMELLVGLQKVALPDLDFDVARRTARVAAEAVAAGRLGYAYMIAANPA